MASNHITKVAVVGVSGHSGSYITEALLKTGKHTVTAITRTGSQSQIPEGVTAKAVDYEKPETLTEALRGQDALVITLPGSPDVVKTENKLITAAGEAGVPWILPNEWSPDTDNEALARDIPPVWQPKLATRRAITELGKSSYIAVNTGFWYEWSLSIPAAFGFNLAKRTATFFDEGTVKMSISTWPQVGRAVAALLSLPIRSEGSSKEACLENYKNKCVYVNSFTVSQQDLFQSALRVTGTKESDWTINKELSKERYTTGVQQMQQGIMTGFVKMMYARVFYPDGSGDFEHSKGTLNSVLDLPKESIDDATERALQRSEASSGGEMGLMG